eukprot:TRINITY_DN10669_c0_g1_i1.p1 TRINITY_DN10669_c0_g1~~TRINITY_DN10669_c0_g1_i1.p1  ORF type:complete len:121 (+),score=32.57 TRINITY_DN10669_c0_g1_i1:366-728(+)
MTPMLVHRILLMFDFLYRYYFFCKSKTGIEVNKPKAANQSKQKSANIFIAVKDNGEIWLDKRRVDVERVAANIEKLLAEQPTDVVIIQADKDAKHGVVVKVMDAIKEAGIDRISIAAAKG